jgi:hypothetical protein
MYKNINETSEEFGKRLIESMFLDKELNGYTFYAHNLGRFDAVFLIKIAAFMKDLKIDTV